MHTEKKKKSVADLEKEAGHGSLQALAELIKHYANSAYLIAKKNVKNNDDAKDIIQEVNTNILEGKGFNTEKGNFGHYYLRAIKYRTINYLRDRKTRVEFDEQNLEKISPDTIENVLNAQIKTSRIYQCILKITQGKDKTCIEVFLLFQQGYSHKEIAESLDILLQTSKNCNRKIKSMIQRYILVFNKCIGVYGKQ